MLLGAKNYVIVGSKRLKRRRLNGSRGCVVDGLKRVIRLLCSFVVLPPQGIISTELWSLKMKTILLKIGMRSLIMSLVLLSLYIPKRIGINQYWIFWHLIRLWRPKLICLKESLRNLRFDKLSLNQPGTGRGPDGFPLAFFHRFWDYLK